MKRPILIAVCISSAVHATLIAAAFIVAYFHSLELSGGGSAGGSVIVTYVDDESHEGANMAPDAAHGLSRSRETGVSPPPTKKQAAQRDNESTQGGPAAKGGSAGSEGEGSERGNGISTGHGRQDSVLAEIWRRINHAKRYPWIARKNGWEGAPRVTFAIDDAGRPASIALASSCGIAELDDAAMETVRRSAPLPTYARPITIAIRYSLRDE